jgi:hypothetical protein
LVVFFVALSMSWAQVLGFDACAVVLGVGLVVELDFLAPWNLKS